MERGVWRATVHGVTESDMAEHARIGVSRLANAVTENQERIFN